MQLALLAVAFTLCLALARYRSRGRYRAHVLRVRAWLDRDDPGRPPSPPSSDLLDMALVSLATLCALCAMMIASGCAHASAARRAATEQSRAAHLVESWCLEGDPFVVVHAKVRLSSGVAFARDRVLTARHAVSCDHPVVVRAGGKWARVAREWPDTDLAELVVPGLGGTEASRGGVRVGYVVCTAAAYPERGSACGPVTEVRSWSFDALASSQKGNSGSGVYFDGRLVGVLVARLDGDTTRFSPIPGDL